MSRRRTLLVAGLVGLGLVAAGLWVAGPRWFEDDSRELAAAPGKPGPDPFGYSAAFDLEIQKVGQINPQQFAARYPTPAYLPNPSWDPTTARFFDQLNVEKVVKDDPEVKSILARNPGLRPEAVETLKQRPKVELPGYKLTPDEHAVVTYFRCTAG